jgi:hypothetical protein
LEFWLWVPRPFFPRPHQYLSPARQFSHLLRKMFAPFNGFAAPQRAAITAQ